jgi:CHASE1-domain containing sensor protein
MEVLFIVSTSWPLAIVAVSAIFSLTVYALVRRISQAENDRVIKKLQEDLVVERMKRIGN